ncbi:prion-like-(Q/N-rich) domain-bearing protein 25 [Hetaerina americana]|uniref:prion-like-(Q/N-rich) domain-bearing protein 25 n=1 Tax=Hetaerina americana TaxID=62018 RepID=UPI003A7F2ED6
MMNSLLARNSLLAVILAVILQGAHSSGPAQTVDIGQQCDSRNILCGFNAICEDNICKCGNEYVPDNAGKNCLEVANEWQGNCENNAQCGNFNGAECINGQCQCTTNHHFTEGTCWITKHLGETCQHSDECLLLPNADRIECSGGICQCKHPYHENDIRTECNGCNAVWSLGLISILLLSFLQLHLN